MAVNLDLHLAQRVREAKDTLLDPARRSKYDTDLSKFGIKDGQSYIKGFDRRLTNMLNSIKDGKKYEPRKLYDDGGLVE